MKYVTTRRVRIFGWIASPCLLAFIIIYSFLPSSQISTPLLNFPYSDKVAHMIAYFGVAFTLSLAFVKVGKYERYLFLLTHNIVTVVAIFIFVVFVGAAVELIQPMLNRSCELLDLIFDALGAAGGLFCGLWAIHAVQKGEIDERNSR